MLAALAQLVATGLKFFSAVRQCAWQLRTVVHLPECSVYSCVCADAARQSVPCGSGHVRTWDCLMSAREVSGVRSTSILGVVVGDSLGSGCGCTAPQAGNELLVHHLSGARCTVVLASNLCGAKCKFGRGGTGLCVVWLLSGYQ
jgi:hypothetical protein